MRKDLLPFFSPEGVALVGASANPNKLSNGILRNLLQYGYKGKVYPVNPQYPEISGLPCYADISKVPEPLDLAVIILPAPMVAGVLEAGGQRGLKAAIIISGGFKEVGPEGAALEKQCVEIAHQYHMRLIGPNCVGAMDLYSGFNSTFIKGVPSRGGIGFVSQSGAVCGGVVDYIAQKGVGFSSFLSLGNEADVTETDMIEYLADDPQTQVIACYVEAITDGARFLRVASRVTPHKPIVLLKAGRTNAGARAVSSHTGSLAGSYAAYEAAFRQAGVLEAHTMEELFDISLALACQPLPKGNRVTIVTNAGGPAALASDSLALHGLHLEELSAGSKARLREKLNPAAQVGNPVDMLGGAEPHEYALAVKTALEDANTDAVLAILVPQALVKPAEVARAISSTASGSGKPVLSCIMGDVSIGEAQKILHENKVPMYVFPEHAGLALGAMLQYAQRQGKAPTPAVEISGMDRETARGLLAGAKGSLGEAQTRPLLAAYGISLVRGETAHSVEDAAQKARSLGYPVALKIVSPDILHKSDSGGIRLNIPDETALQAAYTGMLSQVSAAHPQAHIEGVLVEKMAPKGHEVIVGMKRDPSFGPLMMFGLGGIFVELLTDVSFRVAPLGPQEAREMIFQTRAGKLLNGLRGQAPADIDAVVDVILRLSQLALDFPEIAEVEVNPLLALAQGQGTLALDGRVILE